MTESTKKRTLDAFFEAPQKKAKVLEDEIRVTNSSLDVEFSHHPTYPFSIPCFQAKISTEVSSLPSSIGKPINDQPDLDLLYFQPYVPKYFEKQIFQFLRSQLPYYRVQYKIRRGGIETEIKTPRYTTVFGLDETSRFDDDGQVVDAKTGQPCSKDKYYAKYPPRPIPKCLNDLRLSTEAATGCKFNFCLVNYYASGSDGISYHSDDEKFLGELPAIASFSFGAKRDFLMKHKPAAPNENAPLNPETKRVKLPLASGDMILMKGKTQSKWLHSIPKRTGKNADDGGRINVTFRRAMGRAGTENYNNYNIGTGIVYKWDNISREMKPWKA
ncbi:2OG-Fe(II) oxygenase superfamily protein [Diplocarpon rosae]|nr:2OG-Fe(II) oxygenase superfamily protein [Diplocarpon rosae]